MSIPIGILLIIKSFIRANDYVSITETEISSKTVVIPWEEASAVEKRIARVMSFFGKNRVIRRVRKLRIQGTDNAIIDVSSEWYSKENYNAVYAGVSEKIPVQILEKTE